MQPYLSRLFLVLAFMGAATLTALADWAPLVSKFLDEHP